MYNVSEPPNRFVGRHSKSTKYAREAGGKCGVRMKGKRNIGWYAIGGADYGEGIPATGRREECSDLQELNGNR